VHRTLHAQRRCGCHVDADSRRRVRAAASALATLRWSQRRKAWRLMSMLADRQLVVFTAVGSLLGVVRVAVNKLRYRFYGGAYHEQTPPLPPSLRASDAPGFLAHKEFLLLDSGHVGGLSTFYSLNRHAHPPTRESGGN